MRAKASKEASQLSETIIAEAKEEASHIIADAKTEANRERKRILAGAGEEISQIVTDAAAKLVFPDADSAYEDFLTAVEGSEQDER